jgi:hypothetical protein
MKNARLPSAQEITEIAQDIVRLHKLDSEKFNFLEGYKNNNLMENALEILSDKTILISDTYQSITSNYKGKIGIVFWAEFCFFSFLELDKNGKLRILDKTHIKVLGGDY